MAFALGPEPIEDLRIKTDAYGNLGLGFAQPHQLRQLLIIESRDVLEIDP